jgi:subtilisin family serine protease
MANAWDITKGDPSVVIGIVDTGSLTTVPDLQGQLVPGWDFITNSGAMQDTGGHGTLSATIAVGKGNDGQGAAGYCWRCNVMPVRVASSGSGFDSGLAALGIRWAVDHGARIISIGWSDEGTYTVPEPRIASAIAYAAQHNVLVLASAGNTGATGPTHPAADPGAYAVAGTDPNSALFSWSTYGSWVGLAAPGCQWGYWGGDASNQYGLMNACGSSTSAPAVAGIAGLMLSVNPSLTPSQIVGALQSTAAPVAGIAGGRIDAYRALIAVGGKPPPPPAPPPPPPPVKVRAQAKPTERPRPGCGQKGYPDALAPAQRSEGQGPRLRRQRRGPTVHQVL